MVDILSSDLTTANKQEIFSANTSLIHRKKRKYLATGSGEDRDKEVGGRQTDRQTRRNKTKNVETKLNRFDK